MDNYDLILQDAERFKDYFLSDESKPISYFPKFNTINIIVGANNSGKSRFMRYLMSYSNFIGINEIEEIKLLINEYNNSISVINDIIISNMATYKYQSENIYNLDGNPYKEKFELLLSNRLEKLSSENFDKINAIIKKNKQKLNRIEGLVLKDKFISDYDKIQEDFIIVYKNLKRCYIPILRTAHSLFKLDRDKHQKIENDIYLETLNKYYELDIVGVEVFTGMHLYKDILNTRNSKREIRESFEKFEAFISKYFFEGKRIDIVAEFNKDESLKGNNHLEIISVHIEGEKKTRNLYELGDGIQAIIILMYKIFMAKPDSFIFIDEPELNLHPGMQRLFLEQICCNSDLKKKNLTYIISTHSNHFLDLTIEKENVSIYSFSPKNNDLNDKQFVIKNVNRGDNKLLKDLGVNNSSVFMANCSIWLEGISDRNYIKAFLKAYCDFIGKNYPKEDIDFAFFEYAGSNIDHYIFEKEIEKEDEEIIIKDIKSLALSNRIFLLADSDEAKLSSKKGKRLKALEEVQTDNFIPKILWNLREVENLLTNDIWKEVLMDLCNKTLVKSNEDEIRERIDKALSEINALDFSKKYVGEFLEELRNKLGKISSSYVLNQSVYQVKEESFGTIINKRELSELVFNKGFSWDILSKNKEIENLTVEIYNFITKK